MVAHFVLSWKTLTAQTAFKDTQNVLKNGCSNTFSAPAHCLTPFGNAPLTSYPLSRPISHRGLMRDAVSDVPRPVLLAAPFVRPAMSSFLSRHLWSWQLTAFQVHCNLVRLSRLDATARAGTKRQCLTSWQWEREFEMLQTDGREKCVRAALKF